VAVGPDCVPARRWKRSIVSVESEIAVDPSIEMPLSS